jgi:hypothetical protein
MHNEEDIKNFELFYNNQIRVNQTPSFVERLVKIYSKIVKN